MWIFDAHLDLAMNALEWNRDLRQPVAAIRARERGRTDKVDRARGMVALPELRSGELGLCVATLIARVVEPDNPLPGWHSPEIAWAQTQGQLAWYRAMEEAGELTPIVDRASLDRSVAIWEAGGGASSPIGYVLSLEGADSLRTPGHLERAYAQGLRALGPAHYGPGRYAMGTGGTGGLTALGRELLAEMRRLGVILDVTHLDDEGFWEALRVWDGPVWASHNNCRALVPDQRQFSDEQLRELIAREAVIGGVLDAWMLVPHWIRGGSTPQATGLKLDRLLDHWDHICQLAGNARHIGLGSDLDGGYGTEQAPGDVDTIADLAKLPRLLRERGYAEPDIAAVAHGNWIRFLRQAWK
jgi:membrane dipeptidase